MSVDEKVWDLDDEVLEEDLDNTDYTIKPSHDVKDREAVNGRLRTPAHKLRSHIPPNGASDMEIDIKYGRNTFYIDGNRNLEHNVPLAQQRALDKLLKALKTAQEPGRQGSLMELYEDLDQYSTNILPLRSSHNDFMQTLHKAVMSNLQLDITVIHPYKQNGQVGSGYIVNQVV